MKYILHERRYSFAGTDLLLAREAVGLSQKDFAERCGWTASYQCKLETTVLVTVSEGTINVLRGILGDRLKLTS